MIPLSILGLDNNHPLEGALWEQDLHAELTAQVPDTRAKQTLAVGRHGLQSYLAGPATPCTYYHTEPFRRWVPTGLPSHLQIVAPTQALAEDGGRTLNHSVKVVPLGSHGLRRFDTHRREPGPEELRLLLWPGLPVVDRLFGMLTSPDQGPAEVAALFATFGLLADQQDWHLLVFGHHLPTSLDPLIVANGLEERVTVHSRPSAKNLPYVLNALDLLVCPPHTGTWAIELAMAHGCLPVVVDDARWAERVDQARGVELPCFQLGGEDPTVIVDPTGAAQVLRQVDRPEIFRRRVNCAAWATAVESQPLAIGRAWAACLT